MNAFPSSSPWHRLKFSVFWRGTLIIAIPVVCLFASTLIIAGLRSRTITAREQERQDQAILLATEMLLRHLSQAKASFRGYALTQNPEFQQSYQESQSAIPPLIEEIEGRLIDDPEQLQRFQVIQGQIQQQVLQLEDNLAFIESLESPLDLEPELTQRLLASEAQTDELLSEITNFTNVEQILKQERQNRVIEWQNLTTNVQWIVLVVSVMAALAGLYLFYLLDRELSRRANNLRDINLRLQGVFDNVVDGIITLDQRGYIESCNAAAAKIFGYEMGEMSGKHLHNLIAEESFSNSGEALTHFLGTQRDKLYRFQETIGQDKQGKVFPMELAISQLPNPLSITIFIAIVRNITERKESEATLLKQARLLNLANDTIVVCDLDNHISYWNQGAERLYGWTSAQVLGKNLHELLKTQFPIPLVEIEAIFLKKGEWKGELVHTTKAGSLISVASSWTLQRDTQGNPLAKLEINQDITEAKIAQEALQESEELYRTLVKNFPNGAVFLFDQDLRFTLAEGTGLAAMNLTSETVVGKMLWEVTPKETTAVLEPVYRGALQGQSTMIEVPFVERVYQVHVLPLATKEGTICSGMAMAQDITTSKEYEENLRSRAEELAKTTRILARTTRILEKKNQELDQFAYIVSHDLKAPLRAIANLSSWIEEDLEATLDPDTQHQMELLRGRVHRMEALIDGLLQYSRVGRIKANISQVNVEELLAEVIDFLSPPPGYTIIIEPGMPILNTERLPLQQVFLNLIGNAIKHNPNKEGKVVISVKEKGDAYEFAVADNGPGINPDYHEKIFVMFQTLQARDEVENTGVGLAIVKKIIEDKGGSIHLESSEGQGTTMYFTWR